MVDLRYRSGEKELLDADDIPFPEIARCMAELNTINTLLGGHRITASAVRTFISTAPQTRLICEIGCGGGDNLYSIARRFPNKHFSFVGVDIKKECIDFARKRYSALNANWITTDYRAATFSQQPDIIFSSLFCHHFTREQLIEMLQWMQQNSRVGFFINDLQRSTVAYYLIKWLTALFSRSRLVKNDAALSVARSFRRTDWAEILTAAGIKNYRIKWRWAFRYLVIAKHGD